MLVGIGAGDLRVQPGAADLAAGRSTITRSTLGIAMASVLLSFLMMITRRKAVPQVIGFLAMENGLFFAATSATYGMPMVVELGIALDVLVGTFIFGMFFFQIRETFDSLDIRHHGETQGRLTWRSCFRPRHSARSAACCSRSWSAIAQLGRRSSTR